MVIKLYTMELSPPVRSAMMGFEIFNVPYERIEVNLQAAEHKTTEYLKKNPQHQIPVMEDGDFSIHDSHAILQYLADVYGKDDSWYPKDVKKRTMVNQKLFFDTAILFPRIRNITYYIAVEGKTTVEQRYLDDIEQAYGFFEAFLNRSTYLAAEHVTIADVAALANMTTMEYLVPIDAKKYPKTTAWLTNLKQTPYCKKCNEYGAAVLDKIVREGLAKSSS